MDSAQSGYGGAANVLVRIHSHGGLPFTGVDLRWFVLGGILCICAGVLIRIRSRVRA